MWQQPLGVITPLFLSLRHLLDSDWYGSLWWGLTNFTAKLRSFAFESGRGWPPRARSGAFWHGREYVSVTAPFVEQVSRSASVRQAMRAWVCEVFGQSVPRYGTECGEEYGTWRLCAEVFVVEYLATKSNRGREHFSPYLGCECNCHCML